MWLVVGAPLPKAPSQARSSQFTASSLAQLITATASSVGSAWVSFHPNLFPSHLLGTDDWQPRERLAVSLSCCGTKSPTSSAQINNIEIEDGTSLPEAAHSLCLILAASRTFCR